MDKVAFEKNLLNKVFNDTGLHENWKEEILNGSDQLSGIFSKNDHTRTFLSDLSFFQDKEKENLEDQINKKTLEYESFRKKFFELVKTNYYYEKKISFMEEILLSAVLGINDMLRKLKLDFVFVKDFEESFAVSFEDQNEPIIKIGTYLKENMKGIIDQMEKYRHISQLKLQVDINEKLAKKNQSLLQFINKRKQYTESLKGKIQQLRIKRNQISDELQKTKEIINEADQIQLQLELKYMNRNQLTNVLRNLIRRIIKHEKEGVQKLTTQQVRKMKKRTNSKCDERTGISSPEKS